MIYTMLIGSFLFNIITLYCFTISLAAIEYQTFLSTLPEDGMVVLNTIISNYTSVYCGE